MRGFGFSESEEVWTHNCFHYGEVRLFTSCVAQRYERPQLARIHAVRHRKELHRVPDDEQRVQDGNRQEHGLLLPASGSQALSGPSVMSLVLCYTPNSTGIWQQESVWFSTNRTYRIHSKRNSTHAMAGPCVQAHDGSLRVNRVEKHTHSRAPSSYAPPTGYSPSARGVEEATE